jgi:hypothetical protein
VATAFKSMALASSALPYWLGCCAKVVGESARTAADAAAIMNLRIMDFLPVQRAPAGCAADDIYKTDAG